MAWTADRCRPSRARRSDPSVGTCWAAAFQTSTMGRADGELVITAWSDFVRPRWAARPERSPHARTDPDFHEDPIAAPPPIARSTVRTRSSILPASASAGA
jgi:hypothetical protein